MTSIIERFDSVGAFAEHVRAIPPGRYRTSNRPQNWAGELLADALEHILTGYQAGTNRARELFDQLTDAMPETARPSWDLSVAGQFPCVPAYLAGVPDCMYRRDSRKTDSAPLRVFASIGVSGGITAADAERRGAAVLALCMKLEAVRPVELYLYSDMGGSGYACTPIVRVQTQPLDLASASYAMANIATLRRICFRFVDYHTNNLWQGGWAWDLDPSHSVARDATRAAVGATADDLVIPAMYVDDPCVTTPVEWINRQLNRYAPVA